MKLKEFKAKLSEAVEKGKAERQGEITKLRKARANIEAQIHQIEVEMFERVFEIFGE